jgi:tRNA dimethylallyltransferase
VTTLPREPHLAIVGPTASGKSALAFALASERDDTEIVSLDSMQVYRGMDVGTAKPSPAERAAVAHHLIDVADPADNWSVRRTQTAVRVALDDIEARGRRAILVGGTGLYVHAVVDALAIPGEDAQLRAVLDARTATDAGLRDAYRELEARDPVAAARIEPNNRRRVVRALEVIALTGTEFSSFGPGVGTFGAPQLPVRLVGVWLPRAELARRVEARVDAMFAAGLVDEVRALDGRAAGLSRGALQAIGYREVLSHLHGEIATEAETATQIARRTRAFARRQRMWFRRDPRITWLACSREPERLVGALRALWLFDTERVTV